MNLAEFKNLSKIIAAYLKLDFQSEVLSQLSKSNNSNPTIFMCDEYHEYVTLSDADFFAQSRESKCINIVSTQSYSSVLNTLQNEASVKVIVQNLVNKLWFRTDDIFTIEELFKRVQILMNHEFKHSLVKLIVKNNVSNTITINGNINALVQVINNLLANSLDAYNGKNLGDIELTSEYKDKNIIISVKDHGPGLPENVKEKLFKEMITTKGKDGTGLGLFMSYSNIKAHFSGTMTFESEPGNGTIFNIIIPV